MSASVAIRCEPAATSLVCVGWTEAFSTSEWRDCFIDGIEQGVVESPSFDEHAIAQLLLSISRAYFHRSAKQEEATNG